MNDKKIPDLTETESGSSEAGNNKKAEPASKQTAVGVLQKKVEIAGQWAVLAQVADASELSRATLTDAAEKVQSGCNSQWESQARGSTEIRFGYET